MKTITLNKTERPIKVIQFGEGGFLRDFADWMIQKMNETADFNGNVVVVQPIENGLCDLLTAQNCNYTHIIRGEEGVETSVIDVISHCVKPYEDFEAYLALAEKPDARFIISNTTEAGIVFRSTDKMTDTPPASFPAKLTLLLFSFAKLIEFYKKGTPNDTVRTIWGSSDERGLHFCCFFTNVNIS